MKKATATNQLLRILLLSICSLVSACATIMNDDYVSVPVYTNPGNATIKVAGREYSSPAEVLVPRGRDKIPLTIEKEGFKTINITFSKTMDRWIWGNFIVFPISIAIGFPVDYATGKAYDVEPSSLHYDLEPIAGRMPAKSSQSTGEPMVLQVYSSLTNDNWFPLRKQDMIAAATDKALGELSKLGRFRFIRDKHEKSSKQSDSGTIHFDISLIENIEVVKLTITTHTPSGETVITSLSDSIANKNREEIFHIFEKVGKLAAANIYQLIVDADRAKKSTAARK